MQGKFGLLPHKMPNFGFTCPDCEYRILVRWDIAQFSPGLAETSFDLSCPRCGWQGVQLARDGQPIGDLARD